ncbi:hypothetical protein COXBURSA331_A0210 [Coxiella burnetii RSA 331]|nr:hypothetical protein COXBURSA331_A0210 [Coxiella burnetii RSA 331]EDR36488.1 hypothetical protein COXBURSA334_1962 [Coxiella burnetii Q321]
MLIKNHKGLTDATSSEKDVFTTASHFITSLQRCPLESFF